MSQTSLRYPVKPAVLLLLSVLLQGVVCDKDDAIPVRKGGLETFEVLGCVIGAVIAAGIIGLAIYSRFVKPKHEREHDVEEASSNVDEVTTKERNQHHLIRMSRREGTS